MATPYSALKKSLQALETAHVNLALAIHLTTDRNVTMKDLRLMFAWRDQIEQAETDLKIVLDTLQRLSPPPAGEEEA